MIKICAKCKKEFETLENGSTRRYCFNCVPKDQNTGAKMRQIIKQWALEYKGGKCEICGYNTFSNALEFHHKDPNYKDFCLSDRNIKLDWEAIQPELDKCILVCSNCHRELHASEKEIKEVPISEKRVANAKRVICNETQQVFGSAKLAAEWCGLQGRGHISEVCDGRRNMCGRHPETNQPLTWSWYDEEVFQEAQNKMKEIENKNIGIKTKYNQTYKVQCHTGEIFNSVKEAGIWCGLKSGSTICACCNGKQKTAGKHPSTGERLTWIKIYEE